MQITNFIQLQNLKINSFLRIIFLISIAFIGTIELELIGIHVPLIRELIGFIFVTFIPGILIVRILKLYDVGTTRTLLYSVGISIFILMFTGYLLNLILPLFKISNPLSFSNFFISILGIVLFLCVIAFLRDGSHQKLEKIIINESNFYPAIYLLLIPLLSIIGTYSVNIYNSNLFLMLLMVLIAFTIILVGFNKFIPKSLYPLAVLVISISLLFHNTLISSYIWGWDINYEYFISNLVLNSSWNPNLEDIVNAMLSVVMLAPGISVLCDISLIWVFKVVYPLIFSLVPLGLYLIFKDQTNSKIGFLSCIFFMSVATFFLQLPAVARQEIAELFFMLLLLLFLDKKISGMQKPFLIIIFSFSLIVSHYGLAYIFLALIIITYVLTFLGKKFRILNRVISNDFSNDKNLQYGILTFNFILLFAVFLFFWYIYVSDSKTFYTLLKVFNNIYSNLYDFLNPETSLGLGTLTTSTFTPLHTLVKYINYLNQVFIIMGVMSLFVYFQKFRDKFNFIDEFKIMAILALILNVLGVFVPFFAALNTGRLYHISLFLLSPFFIIGGLFGLKYLFKIFKLKIKNVKSISLKIITIYLAFFMLCSTGFVYEITNDQPISLSLSQNSIINYKNGIKIFYIDYGYKPEDNVFSARWLKTYRNSSLKVYSDYFHWGQALRPYGNITNVKYLNPKRNEIDKNSYIYMGYISIKYGIMYGYGSKERMFYLNNVSSVINNSSIIYSNGGSEILWS